MTEGEPPVMTGGVPVATTEGAPPEGTEGDPSLTTEGARPAATGDATLSDATILRAIDWSVRKCWPNAFLALTSILNISIWSFYSGLRKTVAARGRLNGRGKHYPSFSASFPARARKAWESGREPRATGVPASPLSRMLCTRGMRPSSSMPSSSAMRAPPSRPKM